MYYLLKGDEKSVKRMQKMTIRCGKKQFSAY